MRFLASLQGHLSSIELTDDMTAQAPSRSATAEGHTERVDAIACLDENARRKAVSGSPEGPGRYLEVQGGLGAEALVIRLGEGVTHIGRGLSADVHLDEASVSRRHAMLVQRPGGSRLLDDRSANGTFVNGRRIVQADLQNGDVLVLGRVVLRYLEI
jgi:pSer/pThr/pTyr-binding forkhead associated (FHA) protein